MKKSTDHDGLDPIMINFFLKRRGYSQARLAREMKCHRSYICNHIARKKHTRKVRKFIAIKAGLPYVVVWGKERSRKVRP